MSDITDRARGLLDRITPGQWEIDQQDSYHDVWAADGEQIVQIVASFDPAPTLEDAEFIAAAPDLVRGLLAEVERLTPREITTVEELDALPEGSLVLDSASPPCPWELSDDAWWAPGDGASHPTLAITLPGRVLWTPEEAGR